MNLKSLLFWKKKEDNSIESQVKKASFELVHLMREALVPSHTITEGFREYTPDHVLFLDGCVFFSDGNALGVGIDAENIPESLEEDHDTLSEMVLTHVRGAESPNDERVFPVLIKVYSAGVYPCRGDRELQIRASQELINRAKAHLQNILDTQDAKDQEYDAKRNEFIQKFMDHLNG